MTGWPIVKLDDVCDKIQDGAHRSPQVLYSEPGNGRFPYLTSKNIRTGYLKLDTVQYCDADFHNKIYPRCNVELGDVLLTKDGANTGNVAINTLGEPFSLLSSVCLLKPDSTKLLSQFLFYYIQSDEGFEQITGQMTGAAIKRIILRTIKASLIPLAPLPEQQRIVAILDEAFAALDTATANAAQNLRNARELFESYLQSVFMDEWRTCELVTLSDLATDITDGDHSPPPKSPTGIPFITIRNIVKTTRQIDFSDTFRVPKVYFDALKSNKRPRHGDVLYTVTGSFGIPVIVPDNVEFCFQRHIGLIRPKPETNTSWLYYLLLSPQVFNQANHGATGAAQRTVSLKLLRNFEVPRVQPNQQQTAVAKLDALSKETRRLEAIYARKLAALAELKKSLLHQAFAGEL